MPGGLFDQDLDYICIINQSDCDWTKFFSDISVEKFLSYNELNDIIDFSEND